jgi:hypothetical protein
MRPKFTPARELIPVMGIGDGGFGSVNLRMMWKKTIDAEPSIGKITLFMTRTAFGRV